MSMALFPEDRILWRPEYPSGARWIYSVDIENFFPSTPLEIVHSAFKQIGYQDDSSEMLSRLCCLNGFLAQGAPTSPVLSNICFTEIHQSL